MLYEVPVLTSETELPGGSALSGQAEWGKGDFCPASIS